MSKDEKLLKEASYCHEFADLTDDPDKAGNWKRCSVVSNRQIPYMEGQRRQSRKLAIAHHRRRNGKSEFVVAQNTKGIWGKADDSLIRHVTANLLGSKYHIWGQNRHGRTSSREAGSAKTESTPSAGMVYTVKIYEDLPPSEAILQHFEA